MIVGGELVGCLIVFVIFGVRGLEFLAEKRRWRRNHIPTRWTPPGGGPR